MTGGLGDRTMEMNGGCIAPCMARHPSHSSGGEVGSLPLYGGTFTFCVEFWVLKVQTNRPGRQQPCATRTERFTYTYRGGQLNYTHLSIFKYFGLDQPKISLTLTSCNCLGVKYLAPTPFFSLLSLSLPLKAP